jgi:hypothetical protein
MAAIFFVARVFVQFFKNIYWPFLSFFMRNEKVTKGNMELFN